MALNNNPSYTQTLNDSSYSCPSSWEQFVDTNKVSRSCISKDRQNNGAKQQSLIYTDSFYLPYWYPQTVLKMKDRNKSYHLVSVYMSDCCLAPLFCLSFEIQLMLTLLVYNNPSYTQTLNDSSCSCPSSWEQFVDTNKVSRSCISKVCLPYWYPQTVLKMKDRNKSYLLVSVYMRDCCLAPLFCLSFEIQLLLTLLVSTNCSG
jgi:hypothetical protein